MSQLECIKQAVADHFKVEVADLTGPSREAVFVYPRKIGYCVSKRLTGHSLMVIGRSFNRDHTTVMSGRTWVSHHRTAQVDSDLRAVAELARLYIFGPTFQARYSNPIADFTTVRHGTKAATERTV